MDNQAGDPGPDEPDRGLDVDRAFADIVARFGPEPSATSVPEDEEEEAADPPVPPAADEEHFVPPPPPPLPRVEPRRRAAWAGLLGTPLVLLAFVVLGVDVSGWLGFLLGAAFIGGFGYLVATMRSGPPDDGDDGAVL